MLENDPEKRIKIDDVLNHPWLKDEDVENRKNLELSTYELNGEKIILLVFPLFFNFLFSSSFKFLIVKFSIRSSLFEDK